MHPRSVQFAIGLGLFGACCTLNAQQGLIRAIPIIPHGVSPDGTVIVGELNSQGAYCFSCRTSDPAVAVAVADAKCLYAAGGTASGFTMVGYADHHPENCDLLTSRNPPRFAFLAT